MFATRDQENLIHGQQTAAASKNNALAPKTPGNTGTRFAFNAKFTGKAQNKDTEDYGFKTTKGGGFVTPGPTNSPDPFTLQHDRSNMYTETAQKERAPLGAKTTNVKAKAFQTPSAPLPTTHQKPTQQQQPHQPRTSARKPKLKIHHTPPSAGHDATLKTLSPKNHDLKAETEEQAEPDSDDDDVVPEVEYCPPRPEPLQENPFTSLLADGTEEPDLSFGPNDTFEQFKGANIFRGSSQYFYDQAHPIGPDGLNDKQRREKRKQEEFEKRMDAELAERSANLADFELDPSTGYTTKMSDRNIKVDEKSTEKMPSTPASKSATVKSKPTSSFAAPTAASKAKHAPHSLSTKPTSISTKQSEKPSASRNTIGYAQGRKIASTLRQARERENATNARQPSTKSGPLQSQPRKPLAAKPTNAKLNVRPGGTVKASNPVSQKSAGLDDAEAKRDRILDILVKEGEEVQRAYDEQRYRRVIEEDGGKAEDEGINYAKKLDELFLGEDGEKGVFLDEEMFANRADA